jgi:hypothetical protein
VIDQPPLRQRELARHLSSDEAAVIVTEAADRARINVEIWRKRDGLWRLGGFSTDFAATVLPAVILALIVAQGARACGHER